MKNFDLMISKNFMKTHPRAGQLTNFKDKILSGEKIHTCRDIIEYWSKIIAQVNRGEAVLNLRQWSAMPYRSEKEKPFQTFQKLGMEIFSIYGLACCIKPDLDSRKFIVPDLELFAKNDGLQLQDFNDWFGIDFESTFIISKKVVIIHFTDFLYTD